MSSPGTGAGHFQAGARTLALKRPHGDGRDLRAWDAADEQLVSQALARLRPGQRVAVVDDRFGALSLGLADFQPDIVADSAALAEGLTANARLNGLPVPAVSSWADQLGDLSAGQAPAAMAAARYDAIVLKVPRQLDYLAFLLRWCNQVLRPGGWLLTGGMIKHLPDQAARLYQQLVVTGEVLPAKKKARLVVCGPGSETLAGWPGLWQGYTVPGLPAPVRALPAVFVRDRLDMGSRELLPFITAAAERMPPGAPVLDLACGNGLLGLTALAGRPGLAVSFADISSQGILSARANLAAMGPDRGGCRFFHADGVPAGSGAFPLVLLNPPFHEGGTVGDHIALRLFADAAGCLTDDGEILVVGNRHLGYHQSLRRSFAEVTQLQATPRFVVFRASRRRH